MVVADKPRSGKMGAECAAPGAKAGGFADNSVCTSRYTAWNFVFLNLREQFRRVANVYFLLISVLMMVGTFAPRVFSSPLNPYGLTGTLLFVLGVTLVKDGVEDYKRHVADHRENRAPVRVLRWPRGAGGAQEQSTVNKEQVRVGDYVVVRNREQFPADMILLCSSDAGGQCFVETSNIDGETSLKVRKVPPAWAALGLATSGDTLPPAGAFECDAPNRDIHNFSGRLSVTTGGRAEEVGVGAINFLLRGSTLRNTTWVIGLAVYTGRETKVMLNLGRAKSKLSTIERTVNSVLMLIISVLAVMVAISVVLSMLYARRDDFAYLSATGSASTALLPLEVSQVLVFLVLYYNLVPISMYVLMEMTNVVQSYYIGQDRDIYYAAEDTAAVCRNSTLCQELGQVDYVFSDKTGTLTQNLMEFKKAAVGGKVYDVAQAREAMSGRVSGSGRLLEFFRLLSVCHTVVPDWGDAEGDGDAEDKGGNRKAPDAEEGGDAEDKAGKGKEPGVPAKAKGAAGERPAYEAESPDEAALVEAAAAVGLTFWTRSSDSGTVRECAPPGSRSSMGRSKPVDRVYMTLAVNEFNSTRKRMSVLVQDPEGRFLLYCKGADNVMLELCGRAGAGSPEERAALERHLQGFAEEGLRTLVCASREVPAAEARQWLAKYRAASLLTAGRADALAAVGAEIEVGLKVLGASAVEDRLQDKVPETLVDLKAAGIKVWVLTGDKLETAVSIGYSSRLLNTDMRVVTVAAETKEQAERELLRLENVLAIAENPNLLRKFQRGLNALRGRFSGPRGTGGSRPGSEISAGAGIGSSDPSSSKQPARGASKGGAAIQLAPVSPPITPSDLSEAQDDELKRATAQLASSIVSEARRSAARHNSSLRVRKPKAKPESDSEEEAERAVEAAVEELDSDVEAGQRSISIVKGGESPARGGAGGPAGVKEELPIARTDHLALVIDGKTLTYVMADPALRRALLHIGSVCKALIACRVSPAQKAEIVSLVRDGVSPKPCTLAIGDGANDVTMIQRADLGVGISGREGRQAVNSADFAIGQFRFLRRLLFVHGRRNYVRTSKVFLLSFYKNGMVMVAVFIYSFFTLMSGTSPFSSDLYLGYNWFTGAPVMLLGVFDNDISAEFLLGVPQLYETGRRSMELSFLVFGQWILRALVHGTICAIVPILVYTQQTNTFDHGTSIYAFGLVIFAAVFYCVLVICGIETRSWTWLHAFFYPASAAFFIGVSMLLSLSTGGMMQIGFTVVTSGLLNLVALIFIPLSVLAIETLCKHLRKSIWPNLSDLAAEADWGKAGKTLQDPREFRARIEAKAGAVPRVPMLRQDSIDGMMQDTYTQRQSARTLGATVAKEAGHYVSLSDRNI